MFNHQTYISPFASTMIVLDEKKKDEPVQAHEILREPTRIIKKNKYLPGQKLLLQIHKKKQIEIQKKYEDKITQNLSINNILELFS
jgi:hypothetical protein